MKILGWSTVVLVVVFLVSGPAYAQPRMSGVLHAAKRVTCTFPVLTTATWDAEGVPKAEVKETSLTLSYDAIDTAARANTRYGDLPIIATASIWSLHFLQMGSEGTLRLTTVFDRESSPGKFLAVHTVHEFTPVGLPGFASRPEQHYGVCEVER